MGRDKQIEEMSRIASKCITSWLNNETSKALPDYIAEALYTACYRKADGVIDEVIAKAKAIFCPDCEYDVADIRYNLDWLEAELKKKYESEKDNERTRCNRESL